MPTTTYCPGAAVRELIAMYAQVVKDGYNTSNERALLWNAVKRAAEAESGMRHDDAMAWTTEQLGPRRP